MTTLDFDCNGEPIHEGDTCIIVSVPPAWVTEDTGLVQGSSVIAQNSWFFLAVRPIAIWISEDGMRAVTADGFELMKITGKENVRETETEKETENV